MSAIIRDQRERSSRPIRLMSQQLPETTPPVEAPSSAAAEIGPDDAELAELLAAAAAGDLQEVAQLLKRRPALARAHGPEGQTALHVAAMCDDRRLGVLLVAAGADPQAKYGTSGHTAMSWALTCNSLSFARTLVRLGHKPDLFCAAGMGSIEHVQAFFDTALHWAHFGGSRVAIELLEQAGADRNARDDVYHCTPRAFGICVPAKRGFPAEVRKQLAADPTLANLMDGRTSPLHQAARGGSIEAVKLLLDAGADPRLQDGDGQTARELAAREGHSLVVELLAASAPPS
jgi:ankyrin repeat protein